MSKYITERMNASDYSSYMRGSNEYKVITEIVEAESQEEAVAYIKALYPDCVVRDKAITTDEREAQKAEAEARAKARVEKEAEAKQRKADREAKQAEEMGMSPEEYKAYKKAKDKARRYELEYERLMQQIATLQKEAKAAKKCMEYYQGKMGKR